MTPTLKEINTEMITLARESRGLTQRDLASEMNLSEAKISLVEQQNQSFTDDDVKRLSKRLNYPVSFFYQKGDAFLPSMINFRKRLKVAHKVLFPIEATGNLYRLQLETLLEKIKLPAPNFPKLKVTSETSPLEIAKKVRKDWNLGNLPIDNLTEQLEKRNILVVRFDFNTDRVDSRTLITKTGHPLIILNKRLLGDRQRFSLAYELGHILMHHFTESMNGDADHRANLFAAELLMPEAEIKKDMKGDVGLNLLALLKKKWKVSMQALLYRASDLELITYNQKRYLISQFNTLKIRKREPQELDVPIEKPLLVRSLVTKYRNATGLSVKEMASMMHLFEDEFIERFANN
jgi:Zn-dependent peptidase ImmA (M78 family)/transcriptional regulator with XRE-family HTH domain